MNILSILAIIIVVLILITYLLKLILEHCTKGKYSIRVFLFTIGILLLLSFLIINSLYTGGHKIDFADIIFILIIVIAFSRSIYKKNKF